MDNTSPFSQLYKRGIIWSKGLQSSDQLVESLYLVPGHTPTITQFQGLAVSHDILLAYHSIKELIEAKLISTHDT